MTMRATIKSMWATVLCLGLCWAGPLTATAESPPKLPHVVIITVDTLRFDRVSFYGYKRPTTPRVDALFNEGVRFTQARVPEPLTAPSMVSMLTSLYPHEHGTTRNGLRMRPGLASLSKILQQNGYRTSAFVGNWTLKDQLSGLGEHFMSFNEVFDRKRWFGLWFSEATAADLNENALAWIHDHFETSRRPFFTWIHYVEPHEPYRFHREFAPSLEIRSSDPPPKDRYDTEVAFVDRAIGDLIAGIEAKAPRAETLIFFASDHGESLGEHDYWGHGRHLYDATLHIPLGFSWRGKVQPRTIDSPASLLDLTPTTLGLLGLEVPLALRGYDWSPVLSGMAEEPKDRTTLHQAHKGAARGGSTNARRQGLLEVGRIEGGRKETLRLKSNIRRMFDLPADAMELKNLVDQKSEPSDKLSEWLQQVRKGLAASDELPPPSLDEESIEQLRALGYID